MKAIKAERQRMIVEMEMQKHSIAQQSVAAKLVKQRAACPSSTQRACGARVLINLMNHAPISAERILCKFSYSPRSHAPDGHHDDPDLDSGAAAGTAVDPGIVLGAASPSLPSSPMAGLTPHHVLSNLHAKRGANGELVPAREKGLLAGDPLLRTKLESVCGVSPHNAPTWHRVTEAGSERLTDSVSKTLEDAYLGGRVDAAVPVHGGAVETANLRLMTLGTEAKLVRDEFSTVDFYGRKSRTKQEDLDQKRQETLLRKKMKMLRTPPHVHIYHHPAMSELQTAGYFPMAEVRKSTRNTAAFISGARHITGGVVPSLENSLPRCALNTTAAALRTTRASFGSSASGSAPSGSPTELLPPLQQQQQQRAGEGGDDDDCSALFANNFAGIRAVIAAMPDELPPLSLAPDATVGGTGGEGFDAQPQVSSSASPQQQRRPKAHKAAKEVPGGEAEAGAERDPNCTACRVYMARSQQAQAQAAGDDGDGGGGGSGGGTRSPPAPVQGSGTAKTQEWRNVSYSSKLHLSNTLRGFMARRDAKKDSVAKDPAFLARLSRLAERQAKQWRDTRFSGAPLRAVQSDQPPSIWDNASNALCKERTQVFQCIIAYARCLYYADKIGLPETQKQLELLEGYRSLLLRDREVRQSHFFQLLEAEGPKVIISRGNMKILHFIRLELLVPLSALFKFVQRNKNFGWSLPRELQAIHDKKVTADAAAEGRMAAE